MTEMLLYCLCNMFYYMLKFDIIYIILLYFFNFL